MINFNKVYVIAEAGVNHNGSFKLAKKLMRKGFINSNDSTLAAIELFKASEGDLFNFLSSFIRIPSISYRIGV